MRNAIAIMLFAFLFMLAMIVCKAFNAPGWFVDIVILAAGIYIYAESFIKYRKFRFVRDTATSKIGSVSMGPAEIYGKAKKLPGLFDIYHYLSVTEIPARSDIPGIFERFFIGAVSELVSGIFYGMPRMSLRVLPFYIEDESGKILIDPLNAEIIVDYKIWRENGCLYKEAEIKEGDYVYCIGTARKKESSDMASEINKALKEAKANKEKIRRFDTDGDGKISQDEWDAARKIIESEVIDKNLHKNNIVTIDKGSGGSVFIISNKSEKMLVRKFLTDTLLALFAGIIVTSAAVLHFLKVI